MDRVHGRSGGQAKKLTDAAAFWASGRGGDSGDAARQDAEALGVALPDIDIAGQDFLVWPENWQAVNLFVALSTQWRVAPMGGYLGLDYASVLAMMTIHDCDDRSTLMSEIQSMEYAALGVLNDKRS